jgi:hypothetical protein
MKATIAIATMAKMPVHQWQQCHCNEGNNAIAVMARTPAHQWLQWCLYNQGNNVGPRKATTPLQQGQQRRCRSRVATPLLQGQQHQLNNSKDACTSTIVTSPLSWGQQSQLQQHWKCLCSNSKNAITMRATMPAQWQATEATTLAQQRRKRLHINDGNNHCEESNNCHCNNGKDISTLMAMTPSWQGGATMPAWQQAMRATPLMMTTSLLQQGQQCQLVVGPFAQPRNAAWWVEEEERVQPNLRKGDYREKGKGVA